MFKRILPHACLDLAVIVYVLWIIDRFNGPMNLLGRDVFKIPLAIFLVLVIAESLLLIHEQRKR